MGRISQQDNYYVLVNVFRVGCAEDQERIFDVIVSATDTIERFPGFVSANVHKSHDGSQVVNYAQWRSKEDFDAMRAHPEAQAHFKECRAITDDIEPIFCSVAYVHEAAR